MGNPFTRPAEHVRDGMTGAANIASQNISRTIENAANAWTQAWTQTCNRTVDKTFHHLPQMSRDLLVNAATAWGDRWYEGVRTVCATGEQTAHDVIPLASREFLSNAAAVLSDAWIKVTALTGDVIETTGISMSERFCQNAAECFREAFVVASKDLQVTLPRASQDFMQKAAKEISMSLLRSTQQILESGERTLPKVAERFLIEAARECSQAWRDTIPRAAQVHLKDFGTELKQGFITSAAIFSAAWLLISVIVHQSGFFASVFEFIQTILPFVCSLAVCYLYYLQRASVAFFNHVILEMKQKAKVVDSLSESISALEKNIESVQESVVAVQQQIPALLSVDGSPCNGQSIDGVEWVAFSAKPFTKLAHQFAPDMSNYEIFLKWDFSTLASSILKENAFVVQSPKMIFAEDNDVFWQIVLKQSLDDFNLELSCLPQIEEQQQKVTRKVFVQMFLFSTKYDKIDSQDVTGECYYKCFPGHPKQIDTLTLSLGSMKEIRKYIKSANDLTLRVFVSVIKWM